MLALVQRAFGGPDVFTFDDVADPVPAPGELLVQVRACGLNRLDLLQRAAPLARGFSLPHIAGLDVAGVVVGHGAGLDDAAPAIGSRVLVDPVSTCGRCDRCIAGHTPYCEQLRTVGSTRPGGFAELVAVPAAHAYPIPVGMNYVEAAALPVPYITAWHALMVAGKLRPGETVLINGAGAGVSIALIQFAKAAGATVIGTIRGAARTARAVQVGCDHVIDCVTDHVTGHDVDDIASSVVRLTGGRGVDLAVDHVGPALFEATINSLAICGRMVFCGTTTGVRAEFDLPAVYHWGRTLIGAGGYHPYEFVDMLAAVAKHDLRPVIDSVRPFRELPQALARMEAGGFFGRLIVEM